MVNGQPVSVLDGGEVPIDTVPARVVLRYGEGPAVAGLSQEGG